MPHIVKMLRFVITLLGSFWDAADCGTGKSSE